MVASVLGNRSYKKRTNNRRWLYTYDRCYRRESSADQDNFIRSRVPALERFVRSLALLFHSFNLAEEIVASLNSTAIYFRLPGRGAVPVEYVEVLAAKQLASIDAWLDGSESTQNPNLFDIAHQRHYIEPLEFCVDGVQATD